MEMKPAILTPAQETLRIARIIHLDVGKEVKSTEISEGWLEKGVANDSLAPAVSSPRRGA